MALFSKPSPVSDRIQDFTPQHERAAAIAEARLRSSPYLALRGIACDLHEGVLTLRGRVPSYYLKQVSQALLHDIPGVADVANRLDVATPQDAHDNRDASRAGEPLSCRPR